MISSEAYLESNSKLAASEPMNNTRTRVNLIAGAGSGLKQKVRSISAGGGGIELLRRACRAAPGSGQRWRPDAAAPQTEPSLGETTEGVVEDADLPTSEDAEEGNDASGIEMEQRQTDPSAR